MQSADVTGVILCGGRGSRVGGRDKGLIPVAGRPLIEHVLERVQPQVERVIINANRSLDAYRAYGLPVIPDLGPGFLGPLAGILASMDDCRTPWLFCAPCDAPEIPRNLVARLHDTATAQGAEICCVHDGRRLQPVFCLYSVATRGSLNEYLESGERKIDRFFLRHRFATLELPGNDGAFLNLNSPEDVQEYEGGR